MSALQMRKNPPPAANQPAMLEHIPALLTPDALHALASMGHGDGLAIVDAHFPAARLAAQGGERPAASLERLVFYERAAKAFAIFACGETRTYGNVLLRKGVLREEAR